MVLDKIGEALRSSFSKISRSLTVDKKFIDEIVKDIQRALLSGDVNVKMVLELSERIRKRAIEEKPPQAMTQREYLIKIIYDEMIKVIGEKGVELNVIKKKPFKIMMVGLFGNGKCVHAQSNIPLSNGKIFKAVDLFNQFEDSPKQFIDNGEVCDISSKNIFVPSFNPKTLKIENKRATHIWRLPGKELLNVGLDNGNNFSVKVTPEHPFFVLKQGNLMQIRADQLDNDDFVAVPRNYSLANTPPVDLLNDLRKLDLDIYLDENKKEEMFAQKSIKDIHNTLKYKRNYCKLTSDLKKGKIPIELVGDIDSPVLRVKSKLSNAPIYFPRYLTSELSEFIGYVMGDGHLGKNYIDIYSEDFEIIRRVPELVKSLFGINVSLIRDKRRERLYKIIVSSKTLVVIINKLFNINIGKKGRRLEVPEQIMSSSNEVVRSFIRAYFDCDSSVTKDKRNIELCSESEILIKQISLLLLRFGILSSISSKEVNNLDYFRLFINARYAEIYNDKIGFVVRHKSERASKFGLIGVKQGCGKQDMIPLSKNLKILRERMGFSIGQIQSEGVNSYGAYERCGIISRESLLKTVNVYDECKGNILGALTNIDQISSVYGKPFANSLISHLTNLGLVNKQDTILSLTREGQGFVSQTKSENINGLLNFCKSLSEADVCWIRVKEIKNVGNDERYVYDLTVEDNHSFIADGIIVHNTTSIAKMARYYSKRGYKVGVLGLDIHRPAAMDQLEQNCNKIGVNVFVDKKEKNVVKIYKKFEPELKKFDLVLIDTAGRDALSEDLIKEIKKLNEEIKPDEKMLVMNADIGQAAHAQAKAFHDAVGVTGIFITKMDGTAKGGGALVGCAATKAKVYFIGVGEKVDDMEKFDPEGFVSRLLGMGDLKALMEKAREVITEDDAKSIEKRMMNGEFNLVDLYEQMEAMGKMGPISKIMEMVPGFASMKNKLPKEMLENQEGKLKKWKYIMNSMTKYELEHPGEIDAGRTERIAKGAGVTTKDVRELIKQYEQSKKMMKMVKGQNPEKLMKKFKGRMPM